MGSGRSAYSQILILTILLLVVAAFVTVTYWPVLSCRAILFDDEHYLLNNQLVQNPSWASVSRFLSEVLEPSTVKGYYQPLTMISLMLDCAMGGGGDNLTRFHQTSLALHVMNTMLVVVFIYLLFGQPLVAAAVGLLFGVHPMTVEPIGWIAERKTLLAAFFALWCLVFYLYYAKKRSWKYYLPLLLTYVLALMAKPTAIPLPVMMLLLDFWPLRRLGKKAILEKIPLFVVGFIFGLIAFISQSSTFGVRMPGEYGFDAVALLICHNLVFYLHKFIWPVRLSAFYPFPIPFVFLNPRVLAGIIGTFVLMPVLLISLRWTRALLTGWLLFFIAIFPTIGVIGFHDMIAADRHAYIPSIGILLVLAYFLTRFLSAAKNNSVRKLRQIVILAVVFVLAFFEAHAIRKYLVHWQDTETHRRYMLSLAPDNPILHNSLGVELIERRRLDEAIAHFTEALGFKSTIVAAIHHNLANALTIQGRYGEAVKHYSESLKSRPDSAIVYFNFGKALAGQNRLDDAIASYKTSIQLNAAYAPAYFELGVALYKQGDLDGTIEQYRKVLRIYPDDAEMHCNLGILLAQKGLVEQAIKEFHLALRLDPNLAKAQRNLQDLLDEEN